MSTKVRLVSVLSILLLGCSAAGRPQSAGGTGGEEEEGGTGGSPPATGGKKGGTGGSTGGTTGTAPDAGATGGSSGGAGPDAAAGGMSGEPGTPGPTDLTRHKYSKPIKLDTTPAGANVPGDVAKFPVAVQLTATNFDFSQTKVNGEDVRFSTMTGQLLPYAIELWDATAKTAALWVKVDVKGNSAQTILMHWGNAGAASASDSKAVFSKEDGWLGAYHLGEAGSNEPGAYKDASGNEAHLTGNNMVAETRVPARVGHGQQLDNPGGMGKNQWIGGEGPKFETDFHVGAHPITASAWALGKSFSGYYETVISKGDRAWTVQRDYQGKTETCTWSGTYHSCAITRAPVVNKWTHYLIVQDLKNLTLYLDGKKAASAGSFNQNSPHGFAIAHNYQSDKDPLKGKREWDGIFDEARVLSVAKDASWALLDFESQKEGSKFLSHGETTTK
jgi:biopolymer transport protein ExbB